MRIGTIFIALVFSVALATASTTPKVPFENVESWLKDQQQSRNLKRSSLLKKKALIVHAIDRRDLKEGKKSESLGSANFEQASILANEVRIEDGSIVEGVLKDDQVHYYYYKTSNPASVKATLAWAERSNSNLNLRVVGSHGAIRPWSQNARGEISRNVKEGGSTVERVDTEARGNEEIIIKVSAPKGLSQEEEYVLLVSGCEFSDRQKSRKSYLESVRNADLAREKRVEEYIKETGAKRDSVTEDGTTFRMVDVVDDTPKYLKTFNLNAAKSCYANKVWPGGTAGLELSGSGLERSLGIWDAGAVRTTHREVTGRVTLGDNVAPHSHSSHVGGTMIASGVTPSAIGMAYEAKLVSYDWNSDDSEMGSEANNGLLVSQHSYGMSGDYSYSRSWDVLANQYPMYTISKSASNDGQFRTVTRDGNAKNIITVGSAQDYPSGFTGPSTNSSVLSSFSSKGPAPDGRIKPDLMANGQGLYSMVETGDSQYSSKSGTSMAGPSLAGAIALVQEHYYNMNNETYMEAATLKALAIHTAMEVDADGPDFSSGWGYLNAEAACELITADDGGNMELIQVPTLTSGDEFQLATVHNNGEDIDVTIVWNDPAPSSNSGNALVNDLDLRVIVDGTEHLPWKLAWTGSNHDVKATRGDNTLDNVEKVQIENVTGSIVEIVVSHKGSLQGGSQKFSLIMSGVSVNTDPYVKVSSPDGGEEWELYSTQKIRWKSNVDSPVDILLMDGSSVVDTIGKTISNSGLYEWFIPESLNTGNNYKVKIICVDTTDIYDESDEPFSIVPEELIAEFPFIEPFESYQNESADIGDWFQEPDSDEIDWLVYTGVTPTGQYGVDAGEGPGTGPLGDHTTGDGQYVYVEASYNYEDNKSAHLISPKFDLRGVANPTLRYWLQMYAKDDKMGDLNIDISKDGEWTNDVKTYSGSQGTDWFTDSIDLTPFVAKRVQIRFRGTVGDSFYSDICLDDIGISGKDLPEFNAISDGNTKEGVSYSQDITVKDGPISGIDFELVTAPSWLSISSKDESGCVVEGTPAEGDAGDETVTIKLIVSDGERSADFNVSIDENSRPEFTSTPITEIDVEKSYEYEVTLIDSDSENELTISSDNLPLWMNLTDNGDGSAILAGTPEKGDSGDFSIVLLGDDGVISEEETQEFNLKVNGSITGIFDDGKKDAKESGLKVVPSLLKDGVSNVNFNLQSKSFASYELYIYDNSANLVNSNSGLFTSRQASSSLSGCGSWDGLNTSGRACASGLYVVYLKAIRPDGSEEWFKTSVGIED